MSRDFLAAFIDTSSLPAVALALMALMFVAALAGFWLRRRPVVAASDVSEGEGEGEGQQAYIISAVLGLLALFLGFTFSLALARFEDRRTLVIEEANAIGTTFLRVQLLPESERQAFSKVLQGYVDNRVQLAGVSNGNVDDLLDRNDKAIVEIWKQTSKAVERVGSTPTMALLVSSANEVIDLDTERKQARYTRIPSIVYAALAIYIAVTATIFGYVLSSSRSRIAGLLLSGLITLSFTLIVDIDRPTAGLLREDQGALIELNEFLKSYPAPVPSK
jgi:hypothetical protein